MTALLAKYHGDASFPSGDAALVALFALSISYIGSNTNDDNDDDTGSSRYYYKGIAACIVMSIVVLSASGRIMYVLAHHLLDIMLSIGMHHLATFLGFGIDQMQWWYPLLKNCLYFGNEKWKKAKKNQSARTETDSATKKE